MPDVQKYDIYAYENNTWIKLNQDQIDAYTKSEVDTLLTAKANANGVYTKSEVDTLLDSYYTSSQVDTLLNAKADASTTYTKTETDNAIATAFTNAELYEIVPELPSSNIKNNKMYLVANNKSQSGNVYDIYIRVSNAWEKVDSIELDVSTLASQSDMTQAQSDISSLQTTVAGKASQSDMTQAQSDISSLQSSKADASSVYTKTETDNLLGAKADASTTYTKTQTDTAISTALSNHDVVVQVATLPATGDSDKIYAVPVSNGE